MTTHPNLERTDMKIHGSPNGGITAPGSSRGDEKPEHRCGLCFGPFGKSAIRCKNETEEVDRG